MAGWLQAIELAMSREEIATLTAVSRSRTELAKPRIAGTDAAGLSRPSLVLCGGQKTWRPSSDGTALC
jgi:hypothetical protein